MLHAGSILQARAQNAIAWPLRSPEKKSIRAVAIHRQTHA
jgi:hypothetical protein